MDSLSHARALMGDSLGFHIVFALLGVGLPVATFCVEWWAIRKNSPELLHIAKLLSRVTVFLVVTGVVSGTLISIQMSVFWPGLISFGAPIIGIPFTLEGYAFLIEAVFLAFYAVTWKRLHGKTHALLLLPVALGAALSAVFITLTNAWMNDPHGFEMVDGVMQNVHVWSGLLTTTAFFEVTHSLLSYYLATFLSVVAICVYAMLRKSVTQERRDALKLIVKRFVVIAFVCELLLAAVGDAALRSLSQSEPRKFAAIEAVTTTGGHSPYILGGKVNPDTEEVEGAIKIDSVLSMMTGFTPDKSITGLDAYPHSDWPLLIVHTLFEMKMTLVGFVTLVPLLYLLFQFRWKQFGENRWLQRALIACAPVSILIIELGWIVTELGRQPYAVSGYLTTADAFSKNPSVLQWGIIFPITFVVLLILSSLAVKRILHSRPV